MEFLIHLKVSVFPNLLPDLPTITKKNSTVLVIKVSRFPNFEIRATLKFIFLEGFLNRFVPIDHDNALNVNILSMDRTEQDGLISE
jgi:hypothetical protein